MTYYFAATVLDADGLESDYSVEAVYSIPNFNSPPTLDPINDVSVNESAPMRTVTLSGISSGATNELQALTINAFSSDTSLIPNPEVHYTSPNTNGTLSFTPVAGSFGSATVTVMVDDGGSVSNTVIRTFMVTVSPVNLPPTVDPLSNLVLNENSGTQNVTLSGISSGSSNETQTLTITAISSNPSLIPNPAVVYTSPSTIGTLTFAPAANAVGSAVITVTVKDGQLTNNITTRSFMVTVTQVLPTQGLLTNAVILPNSLFRLILNPPVNSVHKFTFTLGTDAPAGASILTRRSVTSLIWIPTFAQASSTNLFTVQATDRNLGTTTNETVRIVVLDYLSVRAGSTSVQAGQKTSFPIYVSSSDGVTNLTFSIDWPSSRFATPSLSTLNAAAGATSLQNQTTNLLIHVQTFSGQILTGSNLLAQLNFQTLPNQSSAFVSLPVHILSATKPNANPYAYYAPVAGQVVVINDLPLLQAAASTSQNRSLTLFGRVGAAYQLEYTTNFASQSWYPLWNYTQTNVTQTISVDASIPQIFYRILQQ